MSFLLYSYVHPYFVNTFSFTTRTFIYTFIKYKEIKEWTEGLNVKIFLFKM